MANFIIHPRTGERIPLTDQEAAARAEFLDGSKVREAQYQSIVDDSMEGYLDDTCEKNGRARNNQ